MAMNVLEQLELVEVEFDDAKVVLTFLDEDAGEIREITFNKKVYDKDTNKFVADSKKEEQVEQWCQEHFGLTFDDMEQAVGTRHDVYCYDKFNSMWESNTIQVAKFDEDYVGQILNGEITEIKVETEGIRIFISYEGDTYRSNMSFSKMVGSKWYVDPQKRTKQTAKFEEKFLVPADRADELVGKSVMFEVKKMNTGGGAIYIEIKPFPKKSKKK